MTIHRLFAVRSGRTYREACIPGIVSFAMAGLAVTPAPAQVLVGDGSVACGSAYVVQSGDTLSRLAGRAYGDPQLYGVIADANRDALGGNVENIAVGMSLAIPCVDASGQILTADAAADAAASMQDVLAVEGTLTPDELDTLFGPVALFPDQVLTPVLVASTFPLDVVKAARFVGETGDLTDQDRATQAADQPWDDSVRELAAGFPDVVTRMSDHIDWTEQAGEAVVAQTDDVLASVQRLRASAQDNGYLVDNDAQNIEQVGDTIVIAPASPGVVYVPTYDSQVVYTTPAAGPPVYHYDYIDNDNAWSDALVTGGIILGSAVILDEIFDDDDWDGWHDNDKIDWDRGDITIERGDINIDRGDINIDRDEINIDRDRVNIGDRDRINIGDRDGINIGDGDRPQIGNGNLPQIGDGDRPRIGDGDRPQIGDGNRVSIGESDRPQVDRGDLAAARDGARDRPAAGTLPANRKQISNSASRDVARQKIEARKTSGAKPAKLPPSRPQASRPAAGGSRAVTQPRPTTRAAPISKPSAKRAPSVRKPSNSNAFSKPSGHRAAAASNRGKASLGGRGGRSRGGRR